MANKLTWMVLDQKEFNIYTTYKAGVITSASRFVIPVRLYNNYMGIDRQPDLKNFGINLYFTDIEDSTLLDNIKLLNAQAVELSTVRLNDILTVNLSNEVVLSGAPNKGDSENNYYDFNIVIELPKDVRYKINDLKELTCDVVYY